MVEKSPQPAASATPFVFLQTSCTTAAVTGVAPHGVALATFLETYLKD